MMNTDDIAEVAYNKLTRLAAVQKYPGYNAVFSMNRVPNQEAV